MDWTKELSMFVKEGNREKVKILLETVYVDNFEVSSEHLLLLAIDNNDVSMVLLLMDSKLHFNTKNVQIDPVRHATRNSAVNADVLEALIHSNLDINAKDSHGMNALHLAAQFNFEEKLVVLSQCQYLSTNEVDYSGRNALHHLIETTCFDNMDQFKRCAMLLIEKGVNINVQDQMGETPLHKVFQNYCNFIPRILSFFLQNAKDINHELKDNQGYTVFHIMVSNTNESIKEQTNFAELIENKDKMIRDFLIGRFTSVEPVVLVRLLNELNNNGNSAFETYADGEQFTMETIYCMIKRGADVNNKDSLGSTPLMKAALRERDELVDVFLRAGADVNITDIFGQTVLFRVRTIHSFESLCEYGVQLNVKDKFGRSPLTNNCLYTPIGFPPMGMTLQSNLAIHPPLATFFLDHGVDVNIVDRYGSSLLHYAAWYSDFNMIQVLLENGARKDLVDRHGYTPYDLAIHHGNCEVFQLLENDHNHVVNMDTSEKRKIYEKSAAYVRSIIHHQEVNNMQQTLKCVGIDDNAEDLLQLLMSSPRTGFTDNLCDTSKIKSDVHELMTRIANVIGEMDGRFQCTIFPTGSSAEGSQIGDPVEMDFVFCLSYFNRQCEVIQTDDLLETGFAILKLKNYHKGHDLVSFVDENDVLQSNIVRERFQDLTTSAVNRADIWSSEHIYFDGLLGFPEDKPIINLRIQWYGAVAKCISISIDIVPAIHKPNWIARDIDHSFMELLIPKVKEAGFFLLFHLPHATTTLKPCYVRISSAPAEVEIIKTIPDLLRESFSLSKILKSWHFCPLVQFSDDEDDSSTDTESFEDENNDDNDGSDESGSFKPTTKKTKQLRHCIISQISKDQIGVGEKSSDNTSNSENALEIQKAAGWIVSLDETHVIRKIFLPKENKAEHIEKIFGKYAKQPSPEMTVDNHIESRTLFISKEDQPTTSRRNLDCNEQIANIKDIQNKNLSENSVLTACTSSKCGKQQINSNNSTGKKFESQETGENGVLKSDIVSLQMTDESNETQSEYNVHSTNLANKEEILEKVESCSESEISQDESSSTFEDDFVGGDVVQAKDEISSYMLKNCIFYTIVLIRETKLKDLSHIKVTTIIYETLLKAAKSKQLPSYFMPYIDIFSYVDTHIRKMSSSRAERELKKHCARIETFCRVILGILSQRNKQSYN
ncbi:uncharacterized protein LOC127702667 [Mytilus californianus]|uniref:uncharacterized protein LOC127702667 n=1 Tax=Mytilus californianus TaxID=6549 RepID=UPI002247E8A2|nr:uncharacterized protein LOC127702667 [Mytilus californianus]XP_052062918.1 uncharacterized protein LOC127702667 [Mytilus californianus]